MTFQSFCKKHNIAVIPISTNCHIQVTFDDGKQFQFNSENQAIQTFDAWARWNNGIWTDWK